MSNFSDEQLSNIAYSLDEIEKYMERIAKSMEKFAGIADKYFEPEQVHGEWKQIR